MTLQDRWFWLWWPFHGRWPMTWFHFHILFIVSCGMAPRLLLSNSPWLQWLLHASAALGSVGVCVRGAWFCLGQGPTLRVRTH